MDKEKIISFFDDASVRWDETAFDNTNKIRRILDYANITENCNVLDVACGTGVLTPFLIDRKVKSVTGIDISQKMLNIAKDKFAHFKNVDFINADAEKLHLQESFDRIIIFDAFPHFCEPEQVIEIMYNHIRPGGRLTIAHSMGREQLDLLHRKTSGAVSNPLPPAVNMKNTLLPYFFADIEIDENDIYVVSGLKQDI